MKIDDFIEMLQKEKEEGKTDIVIVYKHGWVSEHIKFCYNKSHDKTVGIDAQNT